MAREQDRGVPRAAAQPPLPTASEDSAVAEQRELVRFQRRLNFLAAALIVLVALIHLLDKFSTLLQQMFVALFLVYLLTPPYRWLIRRGVSPLVAAGLMVAAILLGFSALGALIGHSFIDLEEKLPAYRRALARMLDDASTRLPWLGLEQWQESDGLHLEQGTQVIQSALRAVSDFLSQFFVVAVYLVFMLAERARFRQRMGVAFQPERAGHIYDVLQRIDASITQYIVVKTLMSLLGGVLTWAVLCCFGVDYAAVWGVIAFLFNYIPYLGSIVATLLPVLLSLVQFEDPLLTLALLAILLLLQNAIGYLIEPRLAGRRLDLSPLVIILSLAFWGSLWGIVGMILAVPLVVVTKAILEETATTRPLARILANA